MGRVLRRKVLKRRTVKEEDVDGRTLRRRGGSGWDVRLFDDTTREEWGGQPGAWQAGWGWVVLTR